MSCRLFYLTALGLFLDVAMVSAQPGPITTSNNTNLVFAVSTLPAGPTNPNPEPSGLTRNDHSTAACAPSTAASS